MNRMQSVDSMRCIALFGVIVIHTNHSLLSKPSGMAMAVLATGIDQAARFAVPFFLVISGYFWSVRAHRENAFFAASAHMVRRMLFLFLAWSVIYLLLVARLDAFQYGWMGPLKVAYWNCLDVLRHWPRFLMEGGKVHLWFLMGLISCLGISAVLMRRRRLVLLASLAAVLYGIGLAGKAYHDSPLGFDSDFNFRNGPYFALAFFVTGIVLERMGPRPHWLGWGVALSIAGMAMHFAELWIINSMWRTSMTQDFLVGTYLWGTGVAIVALADTRFLAIPRLAASAPYVLGIYLSHFLFVDLLQWADDRCAGNVLWILAYPVLVFGLSYALTLLLSKYPLTRRLVN